MRMHGNSAGKSKKIMCSCIITRKVMPHQYLEAYQNALIECKVCCKKFRPTGSKKTFCSQSCAATFNNKKFVKRKKIEKPPRELNPKKVISEKERKAKNVAGVQAYRARKRNAISIESNLKLIQEIYKLCPTGYEVDHIIALCEGGAHHQDNLQYLPAMENRRKNRTQNYNRDLAIKWQDMIK